MSDLLLLMSSEGGIIRFVIQLINPEMPYSEWLSGADTLLSFILGFATLMTGLWAITKYSFRLLNYLGKPYLTYRRIIDRYYGKELRKTVFRYFIPTRGQDIDPCDHDEIRDDNGNAISKPLIPFFCKVAFSSDSRGKYYIVLADSGMGKSTFMVSLYRKYLLSMNSKKIVLLPLTLRDCLSRINKIADKENTILLLDALDENEYAMKSYESFFADLIRETESFDKVLITCRTQFFPNRLAEPDHIGSVQVGVGNKATKISKKYLSPLNPEEIQQYIRRRYRFKKKLQEKSMDILQKVPDLMARPVILNWMDFLCDSTHSYKNTFTIYSAIIDKWIEREDLGNTAERLRQLSIEITLYMLNNQTTCMPEDEVTKIAKKNNIRLRPIVAKSRSLLNRNSKGEYKFAHRSFFEFFTIYGILTKQMPIENIHYAKEMIGAKRFLLELLLRNGGNYVDWVRNRDSHRPEFDRFPRANRLFDISLLCEDLAKSRNCYTSITNNGMSFMVIFQTYAMYSDIAQIPKKQKRSAIRGNTFIRLDDSGQSVLISDTLIEVELKAVVDLSQSNPWIDTELKVVS